MEILNRDNLLLSQPIARGLDPSCDLDESVRKYVRDAFADNTRRAYRSDLAHFCEWGGTIPATPEVVSHYLAYHGGSLSAATLSRRLVAIARAHTSRRLMNPCATDLVRATFRGVRRTHGTAQRQAKPLLLQDLLHILNGLGVNKKDARDRALLLIGFAAALRRSELVTLNVEDLEDAPQGLVLHIKRSKTDQEGAGRKIGVPYGRGRHCPIEAVRNWLAIAAISDGAVFRPLDRHGHITGDRLSAHAVSEIVKDRTKSLGHDPSGFSGHSLRAGLATSAAFAGIPSWTIRKQTGHATDAMVSRYVRDSSLFKNNAAGQLL